MKVMQTAERARTHSNAGFSLVEVMVAMMLGVSIVGGTVTVFAGAVKSSGMNQAVASLQANARFALDAISADVRMAGFQGCASADTASLNIRSAAAPTSNIAATAVTGAVIGESSWVPAKPSGYTLPTGVGAPIAGTHALFVQYAALPGYVLSASMNNTSDDIQVTGSIEDLQSGDFAIIANCDSGDLFKVTGISDSGDIEHTDLLSRTYDFDATNPQNTRVMPVVSSIYYIGDTGRVNDSNDKVRSLYLQSFPFTPTTNPPIELIEGVDQLQLSFGLWQTGNTNRFVMADDTDFDARNINSVRIGLLMTSLERFSDSDNTREYMLAGRVVYPFSALVAATDATYPADKRMRVNLNTLIKVRNRHVENRT